MAIIRDPVEVTVRVTREDAPACLTCGQNQTRAGSQQCPTCGRPTVLDDPNSDPLPDHIPGIFQLDVSTFDGGDVLGDDETLPPEAR